MRRTTSLSLAALAALLAWSVACSDDATPVGQKDTGTTKDQAVGKDGAGSPDNTATPDKSATLDKAATPDQAPSACITCHGFPPTTGKHSLHVNKGYKCSDCHSEVVDSSNTIISTSLHKNGVKNVKGSFTWDSTAKTCAAGCHSTKTW